MSVAIAQVDGKWPNLALAKIVAHHRRMGQDVQWFSPLFPADVVYAGKTFTDTPDDPYLPEDAVRGGSGYDLVTTLPDHIERLKPDWSLWPQWNDDIGYTSRGCPRRCPFCVVPKKEGNLRVVAEFGDIWTGRNVLHLIDANITAAPLDHFRQVCEDATESGCRLDFSQGLDARLFTEDHAEIVARTRTVRSLHFAFDNMRDEAAVRRTFALCAAAGIVLSRLMFYVLVGFDTTPEEDMYRVQLVRSLGGDPFVMRFDRSDRYQTRFSRWVNNMVAFNSMTFAEFCATFKTPVLAAGAREDRAAGRWSDYEWRDGDDG